MILSIMAYSVYHRSDKPSQPICSKTMHGHHFSVLSGMPMIPEFMFLFSLCSFVISLSLFTSYIIKPVVQTFNGNFRMSFNCFFLRSQSRIILVCVQKNLSVYNSRQMGRSVPISVRNVMGVPLCSLSWSILIW